MANVIKKTTNNFANGLVMDLSPENTQNKVLTHALNATLLTSNGNELSLQNDMGNGRVETAFLPTGYVPVGSTEFGGIIYIASYNPIDGKSQIGSFPSPQRNLTNFEEGDATAEYKLEHFIEKEKDNDIWYVKNTSKLYELTSNKLYQGDQFMVYSSNFNSKLFTYKLVIKNDQNEEEVIENAEIKTVKTNDKNKIDPNDLEDYRDKVNSDFTVVSTKNSGKLCAKIGLNIPNEFKLNINNYEIQDKDLVLLISGSWEEFSKIKFTIKGEKSDDSQYLNVDGLTSINISDYDKYGEYLQLIFT